MNVSIIIPLLNESESINELNEWIFKVLTNTDLEFEVIYIDDKNGLEKNSKAPSIAFIISSVNSGF